MAPKNVPHAVVTAMSEKVALPLSPRCLHVTLQWPSFSGQGRDGK